MSEQIEPELPTDLETPMQALNEVIRDTIAPRPYILLVFDPAPEGQEGGRTAFVTNAVMPDMVELMREFIGAYEARGEAPAPKVQ